MKSAIGKSWMDNVKRNDLILQSLSEGVCIINVARKIVFANNSAAKLLDCEFSALLEKNYDIVFFGQDKTLSEEDLAVCPIQFSLIEGATSHIKTESFRRSDGGSFWVEYICAPVIEDGEIIGAVITFQDITERRDIEAAINEARELAIESVRTKAAFLANMSHEIRTPLSGIVGTANLLANTELNEEQRTFVEMLKKSVDLLMETVNDILDFSKIEAGKLRLEMVEFNLAEIVRETVNLFKSSANKKGLTLKYEIENDVAENFRGDANRLRQVLNNLIGNAVKFTEKGEVNLKVFKVDDSETPVNIRFEVSDTGIGIGEVQKQKLFQPFTQADVSTTRRFGGTGLGLAICREIIELMQGAIGVESESGKGSLFWFVVPLVSGFKYQASSNDSKNEPEIQQLKSETLRILVVEDNEISREIILKLLEQIGFRATTAKNGAEALDSFAENRFDLILMDCQMPELDGYEVTEMIRRRQTIQNSPKIIALTANAEEFEREKCLQAGMDDFLCKPLTNETLAAVIKKYFPSQKALSNLDLRENLFQDSLSKIIDRKTLENFLTIESRGEKNFLSEILSLYCENTEKRLLELTEALQKRDLESVKKISHGLKGSSANTGISRLVKLFEDLEKQYDFSDWEQISYLITKINENFATINKSILKSVNYETRKKEN
jgi:PAS domain S-box-containing protein